MRLMYAASIVAVIGLSCTPVQADDLLITPLAINQANANALADAFIGAGVARVGDATLIGADNMQGMFTTNGNILGFTDGITLSSGLATTAIGPDNSESAGANRGLGGDADIAGSLDANSLSFNFTVDASVTTLTFDYVFASEEYNEFVNSGFNDAFKLLINGTNVALIPGTMTPVEINTVNNGTNSAFYRNNNVLGLNTQYDGLTVVLMADVTPFLVPGVNTFKAVISDRGDRGYDSAVFLQANSLGNPTEIPEPGAVATGIIMFGAVAGAIVRRRRRS